MAASRRTSQSEHGNSGRSSSATRSRDHDLSEVDLSASESDFRDHSDVDAFAFRKGRYRRSTVYDAVKGLITSSGFITSRSHHIPSHARDLPSHSANVVLRPEEVLFSSSNAPDIFEEDNVYRAHRHLVDNEEQATRVRAHIKNIAQKPNIYREIEAPEEVQKRVEEVKVGSLPDGELCEAVHEFTRRYYVVHGGNWDWRSFDETALLAIAILLQESVNVALGSTGWQAFAEPKQALRGKSVLNKSEPEKADRAAHTDQTENGTIHTLEKQSELGSDARPIKKRRLARESNEWGTDF